MKSYSAVVKIFSNGKITIPIQIREIMDLKDGDAVEITITRLPRVGDVID